jgi:glyoxylase-like metal-dependent hydrolase (beta-lactamase superfamily II)
VNALSAGLDFIDLEFLGQTGIVASVLLHGAEGVAIIDPGPSTTLPALERGLQARGFAFKDVRAILLTHIHLDHAGASGVLLDRCPDAQLIVHERGAPHMVDPSKLIASASKLYVGDMARLWGEIRPVPASRIRVLSNREQITVVGHDFDVAWTPGHASHHVSYFSPRARIAFVGDTAGICRPSGRLVIPPTPPPDIDLDAWRESTETILAWNPDVLFLTHFGPQRSPRVHFQDLWVRLEDWSRKVRALLASPGTEDDHAAAFMAQVTDEIQRLASRDEALAYARAGRFDFSYSGLARYWRKKNG